MPQNKRRGWEAEEKLRGETLTILQAIKEYRGETYSETTGGEFSWKEGELQNGVKPRGRC